MAKKTKTRRRRTRGFNLKTALFAYANLAVVTRAVTNTTPYNFLTDGYIGQSGSSTGHAPNVITLKEIFSGGHLGPQFDNNQNYLGMGAQSGAGSLGDTVTNNLKTNAAPAIGMLIGLKLAEVAVSKLGVAKSFNQVSKQLGMKNTVRM